MNSYDILRNENHRTEALLTGDYTAEYKRIRRLLEEDVPESVEREEALNGVISLLLDAQRAGTPIPSIYGTAFENFYNELLSALPHALSEADRRKIHHQKNLLVKGLAGVISFLLLFFFLWGNGTVGVHLRGMAFLMEDSNYTIHYDVLDRVVESELDLIDMASNTGKVVHDDGEHRILVTQVRMEPDGGYNVFFRSYGTISRKGGSLISPTRQVMTGQRYYTSESIGRMKVVIGGEAYESRVSASSGLNYRDGDEFGFHLFPLETYSNGTFLLEDTIREAGGRVTIQLYDLVRTTWTRK